MMVQPHCCCCPALAEEGPESLLSVRMLPAAQAVVSKSIEHDHHTTSHTDEGDNVELHVT